METVLGAEDMDASSSDFCSASVLSHMDGSGDVGRTFSVSKSRTANASHGVPVGHMEKPILLDPHLEAKKVVLLDQKSRDQETSQNQKMKAVFQCLCKVEDGRQRVPVDELLSSTLEKITLSRATDGDSLHVQAQEEAEEHAEEDDLLSLLDSAHYQEAALLAARSPGGALRNPHTMELFKGLQVPPGSPPPQLLFSQALLVTAAAGEKLSDHLSLLVVDAALQHGALQLVSHAIAQDKLTYTKELGDALTERAQDERRGADLCLALATAVYEACGLHREAALSMCRRGLIHCAADFMGRQGFTADDCEWVLSRSPGLTLLQLLTAPGPGHAAILSAAEACARLLAGARRQRRLALQLLDDFRERGLLSEVILQDGGSSVEAWAHLASLCSGQDRADLGRDILSVLLSQTGTCRLSPDPEGARLMEHVFL